MASRKPKFEVDTREFMTVLDRLKPKEYQRAFKKSIRTALQVLRKQAIENLKGETKLINKKDKYNKTLKEGIRLAVYKDQLAGVVHIMGNFKLKWFQNGTVDRYNKKVNGKALKKERFTGHMEKSNFFTNAKSQTEAQVMQKLDEQIQQNILKIYTGAK